MKKGLLIIDVQNDYFEGGKMELEKPNEALDNIIKLKELFRQAEITYCLYSTYKKR